MNLIRPNCENRGLECASRLENVIIRTAFFSKITIGLIIGLINIRSLMSIRSYCRSKDLYIAKALETEQANKTHTIHTHALAVKKVQDQEGTLEIVRHVPLTAIDIFTCLSSFIAQRTNQQKWMVNEETRALIEIPAVFPFSTKAFKNKEINRTCKRQRGLSRSVDL